MTTRHQPDLVRQILDRSAAERAHLIERQKGALVTVAIFAFLAGILFAAFVNSALVSWWVA